LAHGVLEDGNVTPRPPHPLSNLVHLQSPSPATNTAPTGTAKPDDDTYLSSAPSSRSSTYTTDSRGAKRKRSTSPAKQIEERQYAKYPIHHCPVTNPDIVNVQIRDMIERVRRIGRAKGILSQKYAKWAQTLSAGDAVRWSVRSLPFKRWLTCAAGEDRLASTGDTQPAACASLPEAPNRHSLERETAHLNPCTTDKESPSLHRGEPMKPRSRDLRLPPTMSSRAGSGQHLGPLQPGASHRRGLNGSAEFFFFPT
jgi:hypothetical protein